MTEAYPGEGVMVNSGPFDGEPTPASIAKVASWLRDEGRGEPAVTFRLRDWLLSRQRYWGAPIPIVHCETCGEVAVPDDELPVLLPDDVDFQPGGESPLARHPSWSKVACPTCGGDARRDTDTMDTFVDSSWYFFRYCSPGFEGGPFRREDVDRWMPTDQYTGGVEHAILHLLYCRFFTKALYDFGMIGFTEPFPRLMNQGQVIYGGASMSKTKGNVVEPMPLVERWGADSMRLIMLFAGPFEDDIDWKLIAGDPNKRPGVTAWLGRVFAVSDEAVARGSGADEPDALRRLTHRTIKGVTEDLERFRFNTAISKLQVLTNEMRATLDGGGGALDAATRPGADAGAVRPVRRRGAVEGGAGERVVGPRVVVAGIRPVPRRGGDRDADRPGGRQGARQDRGARGHVRRRGAGARAGLRRRRGARSASRAIAQGDRARAEARELRHATLSGVVGVTSGHGRPSGAQA